MLERGDEIGALSQLFARQNRRDSERLSDNVNEDNVNSGARREAVMGVKTAFVKAVGHYSGSLSPDSGAEPGSSFGFLPSFSGLSGLGL